MKDSDNGFHSEGKLDFETEFARLEADTRGMTFLDGFLLFTDAVNSDYPVVFADRIHDKFMDQLNAIARQYLHKLGYIDRRDIEITIETLVQDTIIKCYTENPIIENNIFALFRTACKNLLSGEFGISVC